MREFQAFAATGLLRVAVTSLEIPDPEQPWAPTPAVVLARAVNAELESVDDGDGSVGPDPAAGHRGAQAAVGRDGRPRALGRADR